MGGVLADRYSRRRIMLLSDVGRTLLQATTATLLLTHTASLWSLCVLQAGAGLGSAMFGPASAGLVQALAPEGKIREANSLLGLSGSFAAIGSLGIAGVSVALLGPGVAFAVDAVTYGLSSFSLALIGSKALGASTPHRAGLWADVRECWEVLRTRTWLLTYSGHVALLNAVSLSPLFVLGPLVVDGASAWAAVAMSFAVGGILGNVVVLRWQPAKPMVVAVGVTFVLAPLLLLLAFDAPLWALAAASSLAGAQGSLNETLGDVTVQQHVEPRLLSRASSFVTVGGLVAVPIGMGLAGVAASTFGEQAVLLAAAGWVVLGGAAALTVPAVRRLRVTELSSA